MTDDPLILHLETSTNTCSVALSRGADLLSIRETDEQKAHSTLLTVFIDETLKEADIQPSSLNAIAVSKGPGSYTGLRIGVSVTKGMAYGLGIPVIGITSLHAMARGAAKTPFVKDLIANHPDLLLCPMIDARRMEVYTAFFDLSMKEVRKTSADIIDEQSYADILEKHPVIFFGNGSIKLIDVLDHSNLHLMEKFKPSAQFMIEPARVAFREKKFEDTAYFEPFYLKDFVATIPRKKVI